MEVGGFNGLWRRSATWNTYGYNTTNKQYGSHMKSVNRGGSDKDKRLESPPRKVKKSEEPPWHAKGTEYGKYQDKVKDRLLAGREQMEQPKQPEKVLNNAVSMDRGKVKLPVLDHSKYLVSMSPAGSIPRKSVDPLLGKVPYPGHLPAPGHVPGPGSYSSTYSGPAWTYMNNQHGRFMDNIKSLDIGFFSKAPSRRSSDVLTIDPTLHPAQGGSHVPSALPLKEENDDALSHSIPSCSSGSSLSSSRSSSPDKSRVGTQRSVKRDKSIP